MGRRHASLRAMSSPGLPLLDLPGRCDCGAVTLAARGRVVSMFQCACENCQRVSGGGHSSIVLLPADAVSTLGATRSYSRPAKSGAIFTRHFCPECGTTMRAQSSRAPGLCILPVGVFSGKNEWFVPNQLIFAGSHRHWDLIAQDMPWHQLYRQDQA
jgi:hypothetical protein